MTLMETMKFALMTTSYVVLGIVSAILILFVFIIGSVIGFAIISNVLAVFLFGMPIWVLIWFVYSLRLPHEPESPEDTAMYEYEYSKHFDAFWGVKEEEEKELEDGTYRTSYQ